MADVLSILKLERDRLDRVLAILEGTAPRRGRRPGSASAGSTSVADAGAQKRGRPKKAAKRTMSPEARARMSAMMKKRWAERKKAAKKAAKEAAS